eukprot:5051253-Amphidinium_carterae.1
MPPPPVPKRTQQGKGSVHPTPPQIVKAIPKIVHNPAPRVPVRIVRQHRAGAVPTEAAEPPVLQKAMPKPRILLKERSHPDLEPPVETQQHPLDAGDEAVDSDLNVEGSILKFHTAKLGGRAHTFDLLVEPTLSMLGRTFRKEDLDENDILRIELGKEEISTVVCFPSREQFQYLTAPLDRVAEKAGCIMIDGFLTTWLFALLEFATARTQLRAVLREAITAIKGQMVLSQMKVAICGSENGFKLLRFYLQPMSVAVERMAWEVAYLFNLYMDNRQRENGLRLLRCYILQAGDLQDDCEFPREDGNAEYAFQEVAEGGGNEVAILQDDLNFCDSDCPLRLRQGGANNVLVAPSSMSHVASFAGMMHKLGHRSDKYSVQSIIRMLEGSLREHLASAAPLQRELEEVDKLLDINWCGEELRRDFIRGALLDLLVLASVFEVGVVVLDDNENCRMNWPSSRTVVLRVYSISLDFEPIAILDGKGKVCDLCMDLNLPDLLCQHAVWCGPTHLQVAAILFENVPCHLCNVPPHSVCDHGGENRGSVSDTIPWCSPSSLSDSSVSSSSVFICKQGGAGGARSS